MDPEHRRMYRIQIEDAEEADRTFETLMGADVAPARSSSSLMPRRSRTWTSRKGLPEKMVLFKGGPMEASEGREE